MTALSLAALALRITVVLGAVAAINIARGRASAGSRHWLWMLALVGIAVMPLAEQFVPPLRLVSWNVATMPTTSLGVASFQQRTSPPSPQTAPIEPQAPVAPQGAAPIIATIGRTMPSVDLASAVAVLWAIGSLLLLARLIRVHIVARRVMRRSISAEVGPAADVPVRFSTEIDLPFTYGLIDPAIVLPRDAESWSAPQMQATLTHERAHARRGDGISLLVSQFVVALYWWHPVVWYAAREAAAERERACDDAVLRDGMRPSEYGQCLLAHADTISAWRSSPLATVMFGHSAGLGARVSALLDPAIDRSSGARPRLLTVAGVLGLVIVAGAAAPVTRPASLVKASIVPISAIVPVTPIDYRKTIVSTPEAEPSVCRQAMDSRQARTYRDASVYISGAGSTFNSGVTREIWTGLDCIAWLQFSGQVEASADEKSMIAISDGRFMAHDESPDGIREYSLTEGSSSLKLNGQTVSIGPAERQWIAMMVREYMRRTGKRVHERARAALAGGSIHALLAEAASVPRSEIRAEYLKEGFASTHDARAVEKFIHEGASLLDSSDSRAKFLVAVPAAYRSDVGVLQAMYEEASVIEPDVAVESVLAVTSPPRPLPASLQSWIEKIIDGIQVSERRAALRAYYLGVRP